MEPPLFIFVYYFIFMSVSVSSVEIECTQANEHYACGSACDTECHRLNVPCHIINIRCNDKCYCNAGYARNNKNVCVPISECRKTRNKREVIESDHCGENEIFISNKKNCPPETCLSLVAKFKCDSKEQGRPGCACQDGFLRKDINSPCMPLQNCPELANAPDFIRS